MAKAASLEAIHFRGAPSTLSAVLELPPDVAGAVPMSLEVPRGARAGDTFTVHAAPVRGSALTRLRLRIPRTMPPGTYRGFAEIAKQRKSIVVEVQPQFRLKLLPPRTSIDAAPGADVDLCLSIVNVGNVAYDVPRSSAFGLFPVRGMDDVVARVLEAELGRGERRVDRFLEEVRESHGGTARVRLRRGQGKLEPGETRELEATLRLPERIQAGRVYRGTWSFEYVKHRVEVRALPPKGRPTPKRRRKKR